MITVAYIITDPSVSVAWSLQSGAAATFSHLWPGLSPHLGSDNDSYFAFSTLHFLLHAFNSSLHNPACFLSGSVKVKVGQTCLTPCDPRDYTVHGILQARTLEWVAFPFSRGSSQSRDWTQVSRIGDGFFTSWATREALWVVYASANCITSWNLRFTSYR